MSKNNRDKQTIKKARQIMYDQSLNKHLKSLSYKERQDMVGDFFKKVYKND